MSCQCNLHYTTLLYSTSQTGECYAAAGDWSKACVCLRKSMDGLEAVWGRRDKRTLEVARLLAVSAMICLSVCLSVCLSAFVCVSVCLPVFVYVCVSVFLSVCLSAFVSACLCVCVAVSESIIGTASFSRFSCFSCFPSP